MGDVLFNRKENSCAIAVKIMSTWMDSDDLQKIRKKLEDTMDNVFRRQTNDDMSVCLIRRDPYTETENIEEETDITEEFYLLDEYSEDEEEDQGDCSEDYLEEEYDYWEAEE